MKNILLILFCCANIHGALGQYQDKEWFYIRSKDTLTELSFKNKNSKLIYSGNDRKINQILNKHTIYEFKKTYRNASRENLKKTFFVVAEKASLLNDLLSDASYLFEYGELIADEDKKIFEPNDYGLTSTIGANTGEPINLDYLDFIGAPKAWYYTTGSREVIIGISDGLIDTIVPDFRGKSKIIRKSHLAKGHGYSSSANAVAQGDNGTGSVGVCYDCGVYGTTYGQSKRLDQLLELSRMGVNIINCSWVSSVFYQTAQDVIDEMYDNGTIIVASAGNKGWNYSKTKKMVFYPAAYDKVISVSSVMHRNETWQGALKKSDKGDYYANNVRGFVGRSLGFKDNDINNDPHIWPISTATLNPYVDILSPTVGLFRYSKYMLEDETLSYSEYETTSGASPIVSGTIGLMRSLNPCLPVDEIEGILKIGSTNIDAIPANKVFYGNYGAGSLNTGRAVELVYNLYSNDQTSYIKDQDFTRWEFNIRSFSKKTVIKNQKFRGEAQLNLKAKNQVIIGINTILKPNVGGHISIKIDSKMMQECALELREGFPEN